MRWCEMFAGNGWDRLLVKKIGEFVARWGRYEFALLV